MWSLKHRRDDGTFVIQLNGHPYHVIDADPLWPDVLAADAGQDLPPEPGPPAVEPQPVTSVSRFQARAALLSAGLLETVEAAIAGSGDALLKLAWADAQTFERASPTIAAMAGSLGLTDAQVDDLFQAASVITA